MSLAEIWPYLCLAKLRYGSGMSSTVCCGGLQSKVIRIENGIESISSSPKRMLSRRRTRRYRRRVILACQLFVHFLSRSGGNRGKLVLVTARAIQASLDWSTFVAVWQEPHCLSVTRGAGRAAREINTRWIPVVQPMLSHIDPYRPMLSHTRSDRSGSLQGAWDSRMLVAINFGVPGNRSRKRC